MRGLLPLTMIALLAPNVALANKGPRTEDRLRFCKDTKPILTIYALAFCIWRTS
jgi:hypothetical protein